MTPEVDAYLKALAVRLRGVAGDELMGVYAGGSCALGAYEPGRSDLDVAAVIRSPARDELKHAIVAAIRHESLPCPARGLEFVLYRLEVVREQTLAAGFELNLNTGAHMTFRVDLEQGEIESHWFPIDRSILSQHGIAMCGPPAGEVFAEIPRETLLPVVVESLQWHIANDSQGDDAVLNACRALRFAVAGVWSSKAAAGAWALERGAPRIVGQALQTRRSAEHLDPGEVRRFLHDMLSQIERAHAGE